MHADLVDELNSVAVLFLCLYTLYVSFPRTAYEKELLQLIMFAMDYDYDY